MEEKNQWANEEEEEEQTGDMVVRFHFQISMNPLREKITMTITMTITILLKNNLPNK